MRMECNWKLFTQLWLRSIVIYLTLICISSSCAAQQDTVLRNGTDTMAIRQLIKNAGLTHDRDSAILMLTEAQRLSIAGNYHFGIMRTFSNIGASYFLKNNQAQAIATYKNALSYCWSAPERAEISNTIGDLYDRGGDYVNAAQNFYHGLAELQNAHATGHDAVMAYITLYEALYILNSEIANDTAALNYINLAENLARKEKAYYALTFILINKISYYQEHKKSDSALLLLKETQAICKTNNFKNRECEIDITLGRYFSDQGDYQKSIDNYKAAIALADDPTLDVRREYIVTYSSWQIANDLYASGRFREAESVLIPVIKRTDSSHIIENLRGEYELIIKIYDTTRQYKKSLDYTRALMVLKDSLIGGEKNSAISNIQIKYNISEKDKQLSQNQLVIAQQKNKIAQKNIWMISIGSGFLLLLLLFTGIYMQTRNRQRWQEKENKIGVLKAAVEGGDNERTV